MYIYEDTSRASGVILERPTLENRDLITNDQLKMAVRDTRSERINDPAQTNLELAYKWSQMRQKEANPVQEKVAYSPKRMRISSSPSRLAPKVLGAANQVAQQQQPQ